MGAEVVQTFLNKAVPVGDVTMLLAWWRAWQGAGSP
jgi:hypothetical protein